MDLILVESPTKAKHISALLGSNYKVIPTLGHIMDLPSNELAIEVNSGFLPKWVLARGKADIVKRIKEAAKQADRILIATDPDREGEGIAYHLYTLLPKSLASKATRVEFREITYTGIMQGLQRPRRIDFEMAMAQQARRVLDRLTGYEISPFLWQHIKGQTGLSAGRVQSAALKMLYDREMEIDAFQSRKYWTFEGVFCDEQRGEDPFHAQLTHFCDSSLRESLVENEEKALAIINSLQNMEYEVEEIVCGKKETHPPAPFITTTLLQAASSSFGFSPKKTMRIAQELFEGVSIDGKVHGLITYMRTDSPRVSQEAQKSAKEWIQREYGTKYLPERANDYKVGEQSQDAHECIRPTSLDITPWELSGYLSSEQLKVYELIYTRFIQSQMASAVYNEIVVTIRGYSEMDSQETATFKASSTKLLFNGWLVMTGKVQENIQPALKHLEEGSVLLLKNVISQEQRTRPPSRYTSAQLIQTLEKKGIGRPSTYATIVDTLQDRHYIEMGKNNHLKITPLGISVIEVLKATFPPILDYEYTAVMEKKLDQVALGKLEWVQVVQNLYQEIMLAKQGKYKSTQKSVVYSSPIEEDKQRETRKPIEKTNIYVQEPKVSPKPKINPPPIIKPLPQKQQKQLQNENKKGGFLQKLLSGFRKK
ncbi:DNA topoisomerase-1 [Brevibacillus aydinogluensis]|jgi:DNA topoisomerase I|uniref:type I DNA topoisomerase n=1 Tax=Brevibacillus aydinogluensis TaxID=927786 RepID=UPI002893226E|nr:type I DNA topoisomerase [Brevibacillus aydinogluensis]MDT3418175.1 DNA topoisomerase-1 [Brevibacillus aydinogluensis]